MSVPATKSQPRSRRHGAYLLGRVIGSGGMATVFAARQAGPKGVGRLVAVKVMSTALAADPTSQRAFLREATIATRIEHPNVVRTYEIGEVDGEIFIAMELVHGESLANLQKGAGPVPLAIALRIVSDVARGLHAAHELTDREGKILGLVHQDVTPHNIVVGYGGTCKLLDFGVARMALSDGSRTETVRGKPAYLAPEQLLLERIDRRTDLFALGVVFHELLTGQRLFPHDSVMTRAILTRSEVVPDVREICPDIPAPIADVVGKALRPTPEERFESADAMRRAMNSARIACGIEEADDADVATWARARLAPPWTLVELEQEIFDAGAFVTEHQRVADLPTLRTETAPLPPAPAGHRWRWIALGVAALVSSAVLGFSLRGLREPVRETAAPAPPPATSDAGEPIPIAAQSAPPVGSIEASPRPAPRPTAAHPPAHLTVWSNPWGRVRIDGRDVGDSPISRMSVKSGPHVVSVTTKAGDVQERRISVGSGEEKTERFVF
jgi:hypothetical protein